MGHWAEVILVQILDLKEQEDDDHGNKSSSDLMDGKRMNEMSVELCLRYYASHISLYFVSL